jgi:hypothetical protein
MVQAGNTPTAIPELEELPCFQKSPEGRTVATVRDLLVVIEDLDDLSQNPAVFGLIVAEPLRPRPSTHRAWAARCPHDSGQI